MVVSHLLFLAAVVIASSHAKLLTDPSQLAGKDYDYVVVGAGTAGNVVAARLTEDSNVTVLLLEAGSSHECILAAKIPLLAPFLSPNTPFDWNFTTTAQVGLNGRNLHSTRGRILGGSSSINYMVYSPGSSDDFDRYAALTGDSGWSWDNMAKHRVANEQLVPPSDGHDTNGQFTPSGHSFNGSVSVSLPGFPTPMDEIVIATTKEFPDEFPFVEDINAGNVLGIGWNLFSIGNGTRSSSATAYLEPALGRPNLDVLINAHVTKLVQTGTVDGLPSFHSVEFSGKEGDVTTTVTARSEIILCAGVFGTPTILQLSGIGDKEDLEPLGIHTIVHNPSVGRNMSDHVLLINTYLVNSTKTLDTLFRNPDLLNAAIAQWHENRTGVLSNGVNNQMGWFRLPSDASIFDEVEDPATGPHGSHYQLVFANIWADQTASPPSSGSFMSLATNLIAPSSRGIIKLSSNNPFDAPIIDPNYITTDFDMFTLKAAVKAGKRFMTGKAWEDYIIGPFGDYANTDTDAELEQYIRNHASSVYHGTGTASMAPHNADWGVVDPDLKVKGVEGLRIVDASVIPHVPNGHTQGPVYLVGERGAELIKSDWKSDAQFVLEHLLDEL